MIKNNILFYHPSGLFYGGTEKLLQIMAKYCSKKFNVFFAYNPKLGEQQKKYFENTDVTLLPFSFKNRQGVEPFTLYGMQPTIKKIIEENKIQCICMPVYTRYQFPINILPATMPLILTSPFGHYASNGSVQKVFVSGKNNLERLKKQGIKCAELIYDPIEDFDLQYLKTESVGDIITFGRVGRPDNDNFDSISTLAFAKLEQKYGNRVRYEWLTPPPAMMELAAKLGIHNLVVNEGTEPDYLPKFYKRVDILAHARKDGETFGKAIAEAMLAGLPIITHKSYYHNEHLNLLSEDYARWCNADDVDGYYRNMEWFIEHKNQIRIMGDKARSVAKRLFDPNVIMPNVLNNFQMACENCTYYKPSSKIKGYIILWWQNFKMLPYVLIKKIMHIFPRLDKLVFKIYNKSPWY